MSKLIPGYYKATNHFFKIAKVKVKLKGCIHLQSQSGDAGNWTASDGGGNEYPLRVKYGDFGKENI